MHDHLDRLQIRLFTYLVGQQELLAVKTSLQRAKKTQMVARLMVEELAFFGIRNVRNVATSLNGYDQTCIPRALRDAPGCQPDPAFWDVAELSCGYIQSRQAVSNALTTVVA